MSVPSCRVRAASAATGGLARLPKSALRSDAHALDGGVVRGTNFCIVRDRGPTLVDVHVERLRHIHDVCVVLGRIRCPTQSEWLELEEMDRKKRKNELFVSPVNAKLEVVHCPLGYREWYEKRCFLKMKNSKQVQSEKEKSYL